MTRQKYRRQGCSTLTAKELTVKMGIEPISLQLTDNFDGEAEK